ncbi:DNA polymerase III subunit beta [Candidatus Falkowbacteria bacterium RIFOXYB2_FULL_34_18]|uniref:Beta sliding clamp n=1 Tax=Candidatus Falkowbacteria bacterium RIFOXYD2_FULL_34_120 TaxID=1798007 RepID=A0A1F5TQE7_9BACT|nr:MAG: DNA polymerase III subunit beta [Candidatus Falkowbacteria bacterium RIFOXYB2_FULL_34_18]OGF29418.1 MAG: DNA polymerase III subunit beta [Candidatus Falkowbacteria bacterium RIFOXYC12_FULL_34_55]OGF36731.1 MAG: DNA polymerase III subunit beta [Candidatus Falkowbacteria bacterium RIFOXYC2_FULL_34_220]OGF38944.1 MAG: DNA polymerase III subunit beta [Candidatus Falkowbacteria bacterium RIFOXYD12_FULL_34_57]OGF41136.1 MAG: DNA polymerase III subunit beta [Candidatus Falkowbacteria bacterium
MKISILQENLKNGLFTVAHIASKNVNLPILNNIMIEASNGNIKLVSTNLEVGITSLVRGKIEKEGGFTVESKVFFDFISLLPNQKVDIELKDNKLLIQSGDYKTTIKGQSTEDFPLIPIINDNDFFEANLEDFRKALTQVVFAVSTSESRIELSGVLFQFLNNKLIMAATDSFRLAEKEIIIKTKKQEDKNIIIPAKTLQELIRILSSVKLENLEESNKIKFFVSDNQIMFKIGNTEMMSRLIEGQYPDYKQIIPNGTETTVIVDRNELIRAIKAASIFSKAGINDVNLDFPLGKNKMVISSTSSQMGDNITNLDAQVSGKDNGVTVNFRYLIDGLNNINSENIKLEIINNNTPCILKAENDYTYFYIIMPIKK